MLETSMLYQFTYLNSFSCNTPLIFLLTILKLEVFNEDPFDEWALEAKVTALPTRLNVGVCVCVIIQLRFFDNHLIFSQGLH